MTAYPDYKFDPESTANFNKMIKEARKAGEEIGLPNDFLDDFMEELKNDNDWSLVIKAHALMEAALAHVLSERIQISGMPFDHKKEEISDFVNRLPISGRNGKIRLGESLGLLPSNTRIFIERLSEIRNFYVHDLRNMNVSLEEYVFEKNSGRQHEFLAAFYPGYPENKELTNSMPKTAIPLVISMGLIANLSVLIKLYSKPRGIMSFLTDNPDKAE